MFPGAKKTGLQPTSPILITANSTIAVPSNAIYMHAYIIGGGGSGGSYSELVGNPAYGGGGGGGGAAYIIAEIPLVKGNASQANFRLQSVSFTIGSGGTGYVSGSSNGATGGSTTLTFDNTGAAATVTGGFGGTGGGVTGIANSGVLSGSFTRSSIIPGRTAIYALPLNGDVGAGADAVSGDSSLSQGGSGNGSPFRNGGTITGIIIPWWLQALGLTPGVGGSGTVSGGNKASGGGGGGFGGNGGNGSSSNSTGATSTAGTGYGSGSGGVGSCGANTIGAGAPGCAAVMFEVAI